AGRGVEDRLADTANALIGGGAIGIERDAVLQLCELIRYLLRKEVGKASGAIFQNFARHLHDGGNLLRGETDAIECRGRLRDGACFQSQGRRETSASARPLRAIRSHLRDLRVAANDTVLLHEREDIGGHLLYHEEAASAIAAFGLRLRNLRVPK